MSLAVRPNFPRGELVLDPLFYTSAPFVGPLRKDIEQLLQTFKVKYDAVPPPRRVFSIFKDIWKSSGWKLIHLSVLEDLDRDAFTVSVFRLFIERITEQELPIIRVGALFGLYTFYFSQPEGNLRTQAQIPLPIDIYTSLPRIFDDGSADFTCYTSYILHRFASQHTFLILPPSKTFPYTPRNLPHAVLVAEAPNKKKKAGRKSKKEKGQLALAAIKTLEEMVDEPDEPIEDPDVIAEYASIRNRLRTNLPEEIIAAAESEVSQKLQSVSLAGFEILQG